MHYLVTMPADPVELGKAFDLINARGSFVGCSDLASLPAPHEVIGLKPTDVHELRTLGAVVQETTDLDRNYEPPQVLLLMP